MSGSEPGQRLLDDWRELVAHALHVPLAVERDEDGQVRTCSPQSDYAGADDLPLHRHGSGAFCRFRVPPELHLAGVYFISTAAELVYVGECADFSTRFNAGYGQISPRNCYLGGQETNCRINKAVLRCAQAGSAVEVYFFECADRRRLEAEAIRMYRPAWNRRRA